MTTKERLGGLEQREGLIMSLRERVIEIQREQQQQLNELQEQTRELREQTQELRAQTEEIRRDGQQLQRLWMRLARKYGWLDDEDMDG